MYNGTGTDIGNAYKSQQGSGFSQTIGFPKTDNIRVNMAQYRLKKQEEEAEKQKIQNQKDLGVFKDIPKDWHVSHIQKLHKEFGSLLNDAATAVSNDPTKSAWDIALPDGKNRTAKLAEITAKANLSKNIREEYDKFTNADLSKYNPNDVEAMRKFYENSDIDDLYSGKISRPKLRLKNPFTDQAALWNPKLKDIANEAQQRGLDLQDNPDSYRTAVKELLNNDPNVQELYQNLYNGLDDKQKTDLGERVKKIAIDEKREVTPFQVMAEDFIDKSFPRKPFDYDNFLDKEVVVGDIISGGGNQTGTWESKNSKKAFLPKAKEVAKSMLATNDKALNSLSEKFGITETDPAKKLDLVAAKVAADKFNRVDKKSESRQYKLSEGEKGKEELASTGELWLQNLYSGDKTMESDAAGFIFGKNTVFGDNVKNVEIRKSVNNLLLPSPYIFIKYDNESEAARAAKLMSEQGLDNLTEEQKAQIGTAFNNEVAIPLTEENKQRLKGIYEGSAIARKQVYKPSAKKVEGKFNNIGKQSAPTKNKYDL